MGKSILVFYTSSNLVSDDKDCDTCANNLEHPISPSEHDVDKLLAELAPMIDSGRCRCLTSDGGAAWRLTTRQRVNILHLVCTYGPVGLIDDLLEAGCDPNEPTPATGTTPLHYLCRS